MNTDRPPTPRPPVVLVHGMWSCQLTWGRTQEILSQQGNQVLPYELPEHGLRYTGDAALERLGVQDYVTDLVQWVKQQAQVPVLIGHSMGGLICLMAAAQLHRQGIQVPKVVMVTPAMPEGGWLFSWSNFLVFLRPCLLQLGGWRAFKLNSWEASFGLYHAAKRTHLTALLQGLQAESGRALIQIACWFINPARSTRLQWADVNSPVRIYLGGRDRIVPAYSARVLKRLKNVVIERHEASSHMVFDDAAQDHFFDWLLRQLDPSPSRRNAPLKSKSPAQGR